MLKRFIEDPVKHEEIKAFIKTGIEHASRAFDKELSIDDRMKAAEEFLSFYQEAVERKCMVEFGAELRAVARRSHMGLFHYFTQELRGYRQKENLQNFLENAETILSEQKRGVSSSSSAAAKRNSKPLFQRE